MPITTGTATSFITFTRASTATRVNSSGLIESVASNTPRLDYDPVNVGVCRGLLVEEQRTNLLLRSEEFDNASWGKSAVTVTANSAISPDGSADSDTVTVTAGAAYVSQSVTVASGTQYVVAVHVKKTTGTPSYYPALHANRGGSPAFTGVIINTTTGAITATPGAAYVAPVTQGCIDFGQYWRVYISFTAQSTTATTYFYPAVSLDGVTLNVGITSGSQIIYGAQLEAGGFPTSYIPTTSASVSRSAEVASVPTSAFPYINADGTLVAEVTRSYAGVIVRGATLNDGATTNTIWLLSGSTTQNALINSGGVGQAAFGSVSTAVGTDKVGLAWATNDAAYSFNGSAALTDTSVTFPAVSATTLGIGNVTSGFMGNGHIRRITYIPRRISNAELQARTAA